MLKDIYEDIELLKNSYRAGVCRIHSILTERKIYVRLLFEEVNSNSIAEVQMAGLYCKIQISIWNSFIFFLHSLFSVCRLLSNGSLIIIGPNNGTLVKYTYPLLRNLDVIQISSFDNELSLYENYFEYFYLVKVTKYSFK